MVGMDVGVQERRLAIEALASLVWRKAHMVDFILKPAGVPAEVYAPLRLRLDDVTGKPITKRQFAAFLLEENKGRPDCVVWVRNIIKIAANWDKFHLTEKEYEARAVVEQARDVWGAIERVEAQEAERREAARLEEVARREAEHLSAFRKELGLLLAMFDELSKDENLQQRGFLLQDLLKRMFNVYEIPAYKSFTRNEGAEQIDGGIELRSWYYLVECRWRNKKSDTRELDGLMGLIGRSGKATMGIFLAINGWSDHVVPLLKQNRDKSIILINGHDLRTILSEQIDLKDYISASVGNLNLRGEPHLSVVQYLKEL